MNLGGVSHRQSIAQLAERLGKLRLVFTARTGLILGDCPNGGGVDVSQRSDDLVGWRFRSGNEVDQPFAEVGFLCIGLHAPVGLPTQQNFAKLVETFFTKFCFGGGEGASVPNVGLMTLDVRVHRRR